MKDFLLFLHPYYTLLNSPNNRILFFTYPNRLLVYFLLLNLS